MNEKLINSNTCPIILFGPQIANLKLRVSLSIAAIGTAMKPKGIRKFNDGYISTREAAKMLGIAMSTVYRYFDWGILTGEQHPVIHLRKIEKASVLGLMRTYGMKWEEGEGEGEGEEA